MIDGIRLNARITDFEIWKQKVNIDLRVVVNAETGEIRKTSIVKDDMVQYTITYRGQLKTYYIKVKEVRKVNSSGYIIEHYLTVQGSLHKNNGNGKNCHAFAWDDLQQEIEFIESLLHIKADQFRIYLLEVGVNIGMPLSPYDFLEDQLVSYKTNTFERYYKDNNGICLGYFYRGSQFTVKLYDKGKQFNLPYELMRFELKYTKMQVLQNLQICRLSDLKEFDKVYKLGKELLRVWDDILVASHSLYFNRGQLSVSENKLIENADNPRYWEKLKRESQNRYYYQRKLYRNLILNNAANDHQMVRNQILDEWNSLFPRITQ